MSDPRETLNRIRKQANAATPGPWEVEPFTWRPGHPLPESEWLGVEATGPVKGGVALILLNDDEDDHDAEFIAAARTTVPAPPCPPSATRSKRCSNCTRAKVS